jgi:hypothetical protein
MNVMGFYIVCDIVDGIVRHVQLDGSCSEDEHKARVFGVNKNEQVVLN